MRVTNKMLSNNYLSDMRTNLTNMQRLQQQLSSGNSISRPSDDPFKVARSMQLNTDIKENEQFNTNITDTSNWLDATDTALGKINGAFQRIRELMLSAGNAAYGSDERNAINDEVNQKVSEISQYLNTNFDGRYIFGGTKNTSKPVGVITDSVGNNTLSFADKDGKNIDTTASLQFSGTDLTGLIGSTVTLNIDNKPVNVNLTATATPPITGTSTSDDVMNAISSAIKGTTGVDAKITKDSSGKYTLQTTGVSDMHSVSYSTSTPGTAASISTDLKSIAGKKIQITTDGGTPVNIDLTGIDPSDPNALTKVSTALGGAGNVNLATGVITFSSTTTGTGSISLATSSDGTTFNTTATSTGDNKLVYDEGSKTLDQTLQQNMIGSKMSVVVSQGVTMEYNVSASDVTNFTDEKGNTINVMDLLQKIVSNLNSSNPAAASEIINQNLADITSASTNVLKISAEVGAKQNRMDSAKSKNEDDNYSMTELLTKNENIDITEKMMEYSVAQNVYLASLQVSSRIIQPSLMDYLK
jgi:flagellar hook-associated protein 3